MIEKLDQSQYLLSTKINYIIFRDINANKINLNKIRCL